MDKSSRYSILVTGLAVFLLGCGPNGPDLGPFGLVSGTVTFNEKPISHGMVTFNCSQTGHVATANLQPDGSYEMSLNDREGLPLGEYKVSIRPPLTAHQETNPRKMRRNNLYDPKLSRDIPMKFRYESSSGFTANVVEGENIYDFNMSPDDGTK